MILMWKPILFSAPMVRAILAGKKTQTRRVIPWGKGPRCPFRTGMMLWVKETFARREGAALYRADYTKENEPVVKWTPSIFMPRALSRIVLGVTDAYSEQLQEIRQKDQEAEGVECGDSFHRLWDSINGKRKGCAWADNPMVCVVHFSGVGVRGMGLVGTSTPSVPFLSVQKGVSGFVYAPR
jgi:hypothetical protein